MAPTLRKFLFTTIALCLYSSELPAEDVRAIPGSTRKIVQITNDHDDTLNLPVPGKTRTRFGFGKTDLGSVFEHNGRMALLFGDTWLVHRNYDAIGFSDSTDPWNFEVEFHVGDDGKWLPMKPPGLNYGAFDLPSAGISMDGVIYALWAQRNTRASYMTQSFLIKSEDDGRTWETLYEFSSMDAKGQRQFVNVCFTEHDGFVYIFGSGEYRRSSPKLIRVPRDQFPDQGAFEYFDGLDSERNPNWTTDRAQAKTLFNHDVVGEHSAHWIENLQRWVMLYNTSNPRTITMRSAKNPWGPWSEAEVILEPGRDDAYGHYLHTAWNRDRRGLFSDARREDTWGAPYGPYIINRFTTGDTTRTELYYTMSTWNPYEVVIMRTLLTTEPVPPQPNRFVWQGVSWSNWAGQENGTFNRFSRNRKAWVSTYAGGKNKDTGWLTTLIPTGAQKIRFEVHGGDGELLLLENAGGFPTTGDVNDVARRLRAGEFGRVVARITGTRDSRRDIPFEMDLRKYENSPLRLVLLDDKTGDWGFLAMSELEIGFPVPVAPGN